jgi:chromosome segregation ATPase
MERTTQLEAARQVSSREINTNDTVIHQKLQQASNDDAETQRLRVELENAYQFASTQEQLRQKGEEDLKEKLISALQELEDREQQVDDLETRLQALTAQLQQESSKHAAQISTLTTTIERHTHTISEKETLIREVMERVGQEQGNHANWEQERLAMQQSLVDMQRRHRELQDRAQAQAAAHEEELLQLQRDLFAAQQAGQQADLTNAELQETIGGLRRTLADLQGQLAHAENTAEEETAQLQDALLAA